MLPAIQRHARISFRHLDAEAREELIQEVIANSLVAFLRLFSLGKTELAYPSVLARYGAAQARDGRRVGGRLNSKLACGGRIGGRRARLGGRSVGQ